MKKAGKITLIAVSSVVGVLILATIILGCITVKPLKPFMDYSDIRVTTSSQALPNGTLASTYKKKIDKKLKATSFSVLHAMLEFVYSYGPEFMDVDDEDGITVAKAESLSSATNSSYQLELQYDSVKTIKVKKKKVSFDRLLMNVHTTDGELRWVNVYLYEHEKTGGANNPEHEDYRVTPIRLRMNTSALYIALGEISQEILG